MTTEIKRKILRTILFVVLLDFTKCQLNHRYKELKPANKRMTMTRKTCYDGDGNSGICMFKWDCISRNGTTLSTCVDGFLFGACCRLHPEALATFTSPSPSDSTTRALNHFSSHTTHSPTDSNIVITNISSTHPFDGYSMHSSPISLLTTKSSIQVDSLATEGSTDRNIDLLTSEALAKITSILLNDTSGALLSGNSDNFSDSTISDLLNHELSFSKTHLSNTSKKSESPSSNSVNSEDYDSEREDSHSYGTTSGFKNYRSTLSSGKESPGLVPGVESNLFISSTSENDRRILLNNLSGEVYTTRTTEFIEENGVNISTEYSFPQKSSNHSYERSTTSTLPNVTIALKKDYNAVMTIMEPERGVFNAEVLLKTTTLRPVDNSKLTTKDILTSVWQVYTKSTPLLNPNYQKPPQQEHSQTTRPFGTTFTSRNVSGEDDVPEIQSVSDISTTESLMGISHFNSKVPDHTLKAIPYEEVLHQHSTVNEDIGHQSSYQDIDDLTHTTIVEFGNQENTIPDISQDDFNEGLPYIVEFNDSTTLDNSILKETSESHEYGVNFHHEISNFTVFTDGKVTSNILHEDEISAPSLSEFNDFYNDTTKIIITSSTTMKSTTTDSFTMIMNSSEIKYPVENLTTNNFAEETDPYLYQNALNTNDDNNSNISDVKNYSFSHQNVTSISNETQTIKQNVIFHYDVKNNSIFNYETEKDPLEFPHFVALQTDNIHSTIILSEYLDNVGITTNKPYVYSTSKTYNSAETSSEKSDNNFNLTEGPFSTDTDIGITKPSLDTKLSTTLISSKPVPIIENEIDENYNSFESTTSAIDYPNHDNDTFFINEIPSHSSESTPSNDIVQTLPLTASQILGTTAPSSFNSVNITTINLMLNASSNDELNAIESLTKSTEYQSITETLPDNTFSNTVMENGYIEENSSESLQELVTFYSNLSTLTEINSNAYSTVTEIASKIPIISPLSETPAMFSPAPVTLNSSSTDTIILPETETADNSTSISSTIPLPSNDSDVLLDAFSTTVTDYPSESANLLPSVTHTIISEDISTTLSVESEVTPSIPSTTLSIKDSVHAQVSNQWSYKKSCGIRLMQPTGRIVGGQNTYFGKWPWQALVKEATWLGLFVKNKCGGVLISARHVLTAAHCQPGFLASLVVILGTHDLAGMTGKTLPVIRNVRRMVVHRDYDPVTFENDLALLEMEYRVDFLPHVVPICLPRRQEDFTEKMAYVTGWGKLTHGGDVPSILQEVQVPIMTNEVCQRMFSQAGHQKSIRSNFVCAGYSNGGQDSCEGDSGGPLMVQRTDKKWVLVGTVSHGIGCADPNLPGVYMRMSTYRPWIDSILNKR